MYQVRLGLIKVYRARRGSGGVIGKDLRTLFLAQGIGGKIRPSKIRPITLCGAGNKLLLRWGINFLLFTYAGNKLLSVWPRGNWLWVAFFNLCLITVLRYTEHKTDKQIDE